MITLLYLSALLGSTSYFNPPERLPLEGSWTLTQPERKIEVEAKVPGTVQADLFRAKLIPDPFFRDNEKSIQWVGQVPWSYSRTFNVGAGFLNHPHIALRCEGLDTLCHISINGKPLADTDNMFRTYEFDVRPLLVAGPNRIQFDFAPVEPYLKEREHQAKFPDKPIGGWGYIRKPPFEQGWDFAPKLITAGIWRNIGLIGWDKARITDLAVQQDDQDLKRVPLTVKVSAVSDQNLSVHTIVRFRGRRVAESDSPLNGGRSEGKILLQDPHLWWPAGMGSHEMYEIEAQVRDSQGHMLDSSKQRIGIRDIRWIPKGADHPLTITVNGRPFYAKGSNWVPPNSMITPTTSEQLHHLVKQAVSANMNLLRLWGGGYYEDDAFFDACDEEGLLVWFEFKYADAAYPVFDSDWLAGVKAEAEDNVRRVRSHPCIAMYSGNNEVIGFIADKTDSNHMTRSDYDLLFHTVLADVVHKESPGAAYTPGSPEVGDDHDWNVWHGSSTFSSYRDVHGFLSEFGFQAFPTPRSVDAFTDPSDRDSIRSPIMEEHQRNWRDGNNLIFGALVKNYRRPKDFDSTLWVSQIQQADGILIGVEHWRRDWPHSSGSLVWQFNDCWPSISWSMIDFYDHPKALYYRLRHAYAPIALSGVADSKTGNAELWVVNDRFEAKRGNVEWTLTKTDGSVLKKGDFAVQIPAETSSVRAASLDFANDLKQTGTENLLLWAKLRLAGEPESSSLLTFAKAKDLTLQDPEIRASVSPTDGGYRVAISASKPSLRTWIELKGIEADLSDNFIDLRPGETATIDVQPKTPTDLETIRRALKVRSLFDTYLPGQDPIPTVSPGPDGVITATADLAEIEGDGAILESGDPSNIGNWQNPSDSLRWTVVRVKPGSYKVAATVSIPDNEAGSTFAVDFGGSQVTGSVPGTGGWTSYQTVALGTVTVSHGGTVALTLKPISKKGDHAMNLRSLVLTPVAP